jgi:hypothetical protein
MRQTYEKQAKRKTIPVYQQGKKEEQKTKKHNTCQCNHKQQLDGVLNEKKTKQGKKIDRWPHDFQRYMSDSSK